jgi:hypothetical protein
MIGPARIARGTQASVYLSESVTRDCQRPTRPPAATTSHLTTERMHLEQLRGPIHLAVPSHSSNSIVISDLELGRALVDAHPLATRDDAMRATSSDGEDRASELLSRLARETRRP